MKSSGRRKSLFAQTTFAAGAAYFGVSFHLEGTVKTGALVALAIGVYSVLMTNLASAECTRLEEIPPPGSIVRECGQVRCKSRYPQEALKGNLEGKVIVDVSVSNEGQVIRARVVERSGYSVLDDAAIRNIEESRFPAYSGPKASEIPCYIVRVPVIFNIMEN